MIFHFFLSLLSVCAKDFRAEAFVNDENNIKNINFLVIYLSMFGTGPDTIKEMEEPTTSCVLLHPNPSTHFFKRNEINKKFANSSSSYTHVHPLKHMKSR
jgi:hypothetical protein